MHFKVMRERMGWGGAGPFCYPPPRSYAYGIKTLPDMECIFKLGRWGIFLSVLSGIAVLPSEKLPTF